MLKTAALIAGGMAALGAARRFGRRVPSDRSVAIFEMIGTVPGSKKGERLMVGFPVEQTSDEAIDDGMTRKQQVKALRSGLREAAKWLKRSTKEDDGRRTANKTLGGNREAVCEFQLVKRPRKYKGKAVGITKRCYVLGAPITEAPQDPAISPPYGPYYPAQDIPGHSIGPVDGHENGDWY
jgi:hypothetical protein